MTEQELRALVRDAIALHVGTHVRPAPFTAQGPTCRTHPSHAVFMIPTGSGADSPCLIEPAVPCNHCNYCQSYGH